MNFFKRTPKTVDGVMASFNKTIESLAAVAAHHAISAKEAEDEAYEHHRKAMEQAEAIYEKAEQKTGDLYVKADDHRIEAARADQMAQRLNTLFGI